MKQIKSTIYLLTLNFVFIASPDIAYSATDSSCSKFYKENNFTKAASICKMVAEKGDPEAQFNMAMMYLYGSGISKDKEQAAKLFKLAAKQNHTKAITNLGALYFQGSGVEKNYSKAHKYFKKAADANNIDAQYNIGVMYDEGISVKQDSATAFSWFSKAAEQGQYRAQYNLGAMYHNGEGVPKNLSKSVKWYLKSAEQDYTKAQYRVAHIFYDGIGVDRDLTKAHYWYKKAAGNGHPSAQVNLGLMLAKGEGVQKNSTEAVRWFRSAAEQGIPEGQYKLGVMYSYGDGVSKDYVIAYSWFTLAGQKGHEDANAAKSDLSKHMTNAQHKMARKILSTRMANICELQEAFSIIGFYDGQVDGFTNSSISRLALKFSAGNDAENAPFDLGNIISVVRNNQGIINALDEYDSNTGNEHAPKSGDVLENNLTKEIAPLQIVTASSGSHFFIKVHAVPDINKYKTLFIRGGETIDTEMPLGSYSIKYAVGTNWYGDNCLFGYKTIFSKTDRTFTFTRDGGNLGGYRVELILQTGGNLSTSKIDRSSF